MRKATKKWLVTAAFLVVIGLAVIAAVSAYHWEFTDLSTEKYETNTYEIREEFQSITIHTDTADILFAASDDELCRVVCYEEENRKHSVRVQNGKLTVLAADDREWFEHIGFYFQSPKVTVYLPKAEYGSLVIRESTGDVEIPEEFRFESADISVSTGSIKLSAPVSETVKINTSTGDITVKNTSVGTLDLSASTGAITVSGVDCPGDIQICVTTGAVQLANVTCRNLLSTGSTSELSLKNVIAAGKLSAERSTGDVVFEHSDAAEIFVETDTGNVTGSLLTEKVFITETATGDVSVPKTITGGRCEINTSTGNIKIGFSGGE